MSLRLRPAGHLRAGPNRPSGSHETGTSPCAAAAARECRPSLRRMFATWRCTVWGLRTSRSAISPSLNPSATSRRTRAREESAPRPRSPSRARRRPPEERRDRREDGVDVTLPRKMSVALEHDELGARGERRRAARPRQTDHAICLAGGRSASEPAQPGNRLADRSRNVSSSSSGQIGRHLGRHAGKRRTTHAPRVAARGEGVGEHAAAESPVLAHELEIAAAAGGRARRRSRRRRRGGGDRHARGSAPRTRPPCTPERPAEQGHALELEVVDEGREHRDLVFELERLARPFAIRHPAPEAVVADRVLSSGRAPFMNRRKPRSSSPRRRC